MVQYCYKNRKTDQENRIQSPKMYLLSIQKNIDIGPYRPWENNVLEQTAVYIRGN